MEMIKPVTWTDFCQLRWTKRERLNSRMGKVKFEKFLSENNFPYSKILRKFDDYEDLSFDGLPNKFVLKPSNLWSARGVMLLTALGDGFYLDDMSEKKCSLEDIVRDLGLIKSKFSAKEMPVILEERVIDEDERNVIPFDYKFFTFYGKVKFILQVDRNHKKPKIAFFDENFEPISDNRVSVPENKLDTLGANRRPECYVDLMSMASELSIKLKSPFISIDCYASSHGPVFGELTHTPGGPWYGSMYRFSKEFDKELGAAWYEAANALGIDVPLVESEYNILLKGKLMRTVSHSMG